MTTAEFAIALCASIAFILLPLIAVEYPPLNDYPAHLARIHILHNWDRIPEFSQWYQIQSAILPNAGFDTIVLLLSNVMSIPSAGLVFVGITNVVTFTGVIFFHRCLHSRLTLWPFVAAFFIYNWILIFGFMSYLLGIGLTLWAAGCWILLSRLGIWSRLLAGSLIGVVLFFCHLVPLALYAVIVAGYELQRSYTLARTDVGAAVRNLIVGALPFLLPFGLFLASRTAHEQGLFSYSDYWPLVKFAKLRMLLSANWLLDVSAVVVGIVALLVIWRRGTVRFARPMAWAVILLMIVYFAAPMAAFTGTYTDTRLPVALAFIAIAVFQVDLRGTALRRVAVAVLVVYLAFRVVFLAYTWDEYSDDIAGIAESVSVVPKNSLLFAASAIGEPRPADIDLIRWQPPLSYVSSLVSLHKPIFSANTFALRGQHLIGIRPEYVTLYDVQNHSVERTPTTAKVMAYAERIRGAAAQTGHQNEPSYLLLLYPDRLVGNEFPTLKMISRGAKFVLFAL